MREISYILKNGYRQQTECDSNNITLIRLKTSWITGEGLVSSIFFFLHNGFKGGYLDFSHLSEFKNIYITEIDMKKQYKSSIIKNHKITNKKKIDGVPFKGYVTS